MSLKSFHIVFIALSAILAFGSAAYAVISVDGAMGIVWASLAVVSGGALIVYGKRFLTKMKTLEAAG
ncbi:MAG: hypothetical protein ACI80V_000345 [Rhodothermales bacterium]|jgi:hypothetical protein